MSAQSEKTVLPQEYVMRLYESYQAMAEACLELKASIEKDAENYPVYVPTYAESEDDRSSEDARITAIKSMTQMFVLNKDEQQRHAGILCGSGETVDAAEKLNGAKKEFKSAIKAIKEFQNVSDIAVSRVTKLINDEVVEKGYRTKRLSQALGTAGIRSLDLKRCYALIKIMPPKLDVFTWTWATTHTRIKKITLDQATEMAKKLSEKDAPVALDLLGRCRPGEIFAKRVPLPNQLRCNYAYLDGNEITRENDNISGIVIAQQHHMPRKLWRDNPGKNNLPRLKRSSRIQEEVYVKALDLHRYET